MGQGESKLGKQAIQLGDNDAKLEFEFGLLPGDQVYDEGSSKPGIYCRLVKAPEWLLSVSMSYTLQFDGEEWTVQVGGTKKTGALLKSRTFHVDDTAEPDPSWIAEESDEFMVAEKLEELINAINAKLPEWKTSTEEQRADKVLEKQRFDAIEFADGEFDIATRSARPKYTKTKFISAPQALIDLFEASGEKQKFKFTFQEQEWKLIVQNSNKSHIDVKDRKIFLDVAHHPGHSKKLPEDIVQPLMQALNEQAEVFVEQAKRDQEQAQQFKDVKEVEESDEIEYVYFNGRAKLARAPKWLLECNESFMFRMDAKEIWTFVVDQQRMAGWRGGTKFVFNKDKFKDDKDKIEQIIQAVNPALPDWKRAWEKKRGKEEDDLERYGPLLSEHPLKMIKRAMEMLEQ